MGASTIIVEGILMIAAIVTASVFASAFLTRLSDVNSAVNSMVRGYSERVKTNLMIIYATYLNNAGYFVVYARNIGKTTIFIKRCSVYFGNSTRLDLYTYDVDGVAQPGEWDYDEVDGTDDGLWSPGETLKIYIYNVTSLNPPYKVKIVAPNGYVVEETFAPLT